MYTSVRIYLLYCTYVITYVQLTNCTELAYIENLSLNDTSNSYKIDRLTGSVIER